MGHLGSANNYRPTIFGLNKDDTAIIQFSTNKIVTAATMLLSCSQIMRVPPVSSFAQAKRAHSPCESTLVVFQTNKLIAMLTDVAR